MKEGLLRIGQFAKLRGISVKCLRYYERVGALMPAFVDPNSGYRYYSINQINDLDVVISLIELGIPLKDLAFYMAQGADSVQAVVDQGIKLARTRARNAQAQIIQLENYADSIAQQRRFKGLTSTYVRQIPPRLVLCQPLGNAPVTPAPKGAAAPAAPATPASTTHASPANKGPQGTGHFSITQYSQITGGLYNRAQDLGLISLFTQGLLYDADAAAGAQWQCYLECSVLPGEEHLIDQANLTRIPAMEVTCTRIAGQDFRDCFLRGLAALTAPRTQGIHALAEVWNATPEDGRFVLEVQSPRIKPAQVAGTICSDPQYPNPA